MTGYTGPTGYTGATGYTGPSTPITVARTTATIGSTSGALVKVTALDLATGTGTFVFQYFIRWQTGTTGSGVKFTCNHTGTVTSFVASCRCVTSGTTAANQTALQATGATSTLVEGGSQRAKSSATAMTVYTGGADATGDMMMVIEGLCVVTVTGNLELYWSPETTSIGYVMSDSALILTKIA